MKTAQNVTRTGMARAKGEHLSAANDTPKLDCPLMSRSFRYTPAESTDVTATWRRFGWTPPLRGLR